MNTLKKSSSPKHDASLIRNLAGKGNIEAQFRLGQIYENGEGFTKDFTKAVHWYRKAAANGNSCAQNSLGDMYQFGRGVEQDFAEAVTWYRKAAEQNDPIAENNLAELCWNSSETDEEIQAILNLFHKAAEAGNADAQHNLSEIYFTGDHVKRDTDQALKWLLKAANQGLVRAQNELGIRYSQGMEVPEDHTQSAIWYQKAAEQNHDESQFSLGLKYWYGLGVKQDNAVGVAWIISAAKHGLPRAQKFLHDMNKEVSQVTTETQQSGTKSTDYVDYTYGDHDFESPYNSMIRIENKGGEIKETNYFDLPQAEQGLFYLSWNSGVGRLLVPDIQQQYLGEIGTGKKIVIIQYRNDIEVVFDDHSESPFFITLGTVQTDRIIAVPAKDIMLIVYSREGEKYRFPAELRVSKKDYAPGLSL
jgi:TPR repeat protein